MFHVSVRALKAIDNKNGTFTLEVDGRNLSEQEAQLLESLFPNTFHQAEQLLATEALIGSIATDREVRAPEAELHHCYNCSTPYRGSDEKYCPNCRVPVAVEPVRSVKQPRNKSIDDQ